MTTPTYTMDILTSYQPDPIAPGYYFLYFRPSITTWPDFSLTTDLSRYVFIGATMDPSGNPTYPTIEAAIEGEYSLFATTLLANANGQESGFYTFVLGSRINWDVSLSYNYEYLLKLSSAQSDWNETDASAVDYIKNKPTIPNIARTTSALVLSLVGSGATGTQISSTKDSTVRANVSLSATASISGGATSNITLKKCATNSATETDWVIALPTPGEIGQSYSLAIALQGVQTDKRQLSIEVPAGWYVKAENSGTGTHTESILGAEKTIYG